MRFSPRAQGLVAALVTVTIWTAFIVIARASAQRTLTPFDIAFLRIVGASLVLLPWGWWIVRHRTAAPAGTVATSSLAGLSPLPLRTTVQLGLFGGVVYALLAYSGFFYAPATHASVLMPGSLPLWTALLAALLLAERITPARATGLALIVAGDVLVGGRSLLAAFDGGDVWKGDLLFMGAASCWATYSVLARRHGVGAVHATIAITALACGGGRALAGGAAGAWCAGAAWNGWFGALCGAVRAVPVPATRSVVGAGGASAGAATASSGHQTRTPISCSIARWRASRCRLIGRHS